MGCEVCIGTDVDNCDGILQMYNCAYPISKRERKCAECRRVIPRGERYSSVSYKFDGEFQRETSCLICDEIKRVFSCGEVPPVYGYLWRDMQEYAFPGLTTASQCFSQLSPQAKAFVLEQWRQWRFHGTS